MPLFDDRALGALERGMDGMWLKQQIASHNIANVETPGYKAKKVEFRDVLYETAQGTERISKPVSGKLSTLRYVINNTGK